MSTKTTVNAKALAIVGTLGAIGLKAIEYQNAVEARKKAAIAFGDACAKWKQKHRLEFIPKNSPEWDQMMKGLPYRVHDEIRRAKVGEKNARARLFRACRKAEPA